MKTNHERAGFRLAFCIALLGTLTGCIGYVDAPRHERVVYAQPAPVYAESQAVIEDDYVYYPGYQVYYSSNRRQYIYQDGRSWVSRPAPPRVSIDVLFASPSVRLDFHDSPSIHHATVVRQYPRNWAPPGSNFHPGNGNRGNGNRGNGNGNDRRDRD